MEVASDLQHISSSAQKHAPKSQHKTHPNPELKAWNRQGKEWTRTHREVALGGRHPEVGAAGVEDDGELLLRRADADLPKVLRVHVVLKRDDVAVVAARAQGVGAAEEEALPLLGGEARGDAAVLVDGLLLQRDPHQALRRRRRGEQGLEQRRCQEHQGDAAGSHGRDLRKSKAEPTRSNGFSL